MKPASDAPSTSADFDKVYSSPFHWLWSDTRIPGELKQLVADHKPRATLELGCGLGVFSAYLAGQGLAATGIDFSPRAILKARSRVAARELKPTFLTGDVAQLPLPASSFDAALDVGCFHCLDEARQKQYALETARVLKPGSPLLVWAIDNSPGGRSLGPAAIAGTFAPHFELTQARFSRRRVVASHWYWLKRNA